MGLMPPKAEANTARAQYEQIREQNMARTQAGWESDLLIQQGMRSWIEAGGQMPSQHPAPSAEHQKTDANWKPIIPIVAGLLVGRAERNAR